MQARAMRREFSFLGIKLPDPDSRMTVEDAEAPFPCNTRSLRRRPSVDRKPSATR